MPPKSKTATKKPVKSSKPDTSPPPRKWAKCHERFLVPELRRRRLPEVGHQNSLIARLKATDPPTLRTPESRKALHQKQLKRLQNAALKNIHPFPQFQKLPLEIRERIWEFSLPGPRGLTLDTHQKRLVPERLWFSRIFKWKNPAALKTCRESRTVALRKYKLAFGTPNVYFDFEGGDILYFGPECWNGIFLDQEWEWVQSMIWVQNEEPKMVMGQLNQEVVRDFESVRHLAIARELWNNTHEGYAWFGWKFALGLNGRGELFRKRLRKFKGVQRISLEHGNERLNNLSDHKVFCGGPVIEDPWFQERPRDWRIKSEEPFDIHLYKQYVPKIEKWLNMDGRWEVTGDLTAAALLSRFDTEDLSEEEEEKGVPEARLVDIKYIVDQPRMVREKFWSY